MKMKKALLGAFIALLVPTMALASVKVRIDDVESGFANELSVSSTYGTLVGDKLTITAPAMANGEVLSNTSDDIVRIASDDSNIALDVYSPLTSNGTAEIRLIGDAGADATDRFNIKNDAAGNLTIGNDSSVAGTYVTKLTLDSAGIITTSNDIIIDGTTPQLTIGSTTGQGTPIVFEGATADAFETSLLIADPTADINITIPATATSAGVMLTSLTTNQVDAANAVTGTSNGFIAEGATADAFETTVSFADPTADQTVTVPATAGAAGTVALKGATVVITAGTTPTLTVPLGVDFIATDTITTDNQDQTITFSSGGSAGQLCRLLFQTDSGGSNDEVITLHTTLTNTTGTLTLANLTAGRYSLVLQSDGTVWNEVSRTGALS